MSHQTVTTNTDRPMNHLNDWLQTHNMTQAELADTLGVTR